MQNKKQVSGKEGRGTNEGWQTEGSKKRKGGEAKLRCKEKRQQGRTKEKKQKQSFEAEGRKDMTKSGMSVKVKESRARRKTDTH